MGSVDFEWVRQQFIESKTKIVVGLAVMKLLETWQEIDLTPDQAKEVFEILGSLAQGHAIAASKPDEVWVGARRGDLKVGDEVRVKRDAYSGELGTLHNGRRGKIIAIRSGDIIIRTLDNKSPSLDGVHYAPDQLEKRIV